MLQNKNKNKNKITIALLITLSIVCILLSAAPFTPAVFIALLLICVAGVYGFFQQTILAVVLMSLNFLAVVVSPIMMLGSPLLWLVFVPCAVGIGGTLSGFVMRKRVTANDR